VPREFPGVNAWAREKFSAFESSNERCPVVAEQKQNKRSLYGTTILRSPGAARLKVEEGEIEMRPGSFLHIPSHRRHRVEWTAPDEPTIWLAIHYGGEPL